MPTEQTTLAGTTEQPVCPPQRKVLCAHILILTCFQEEGSPLQTQQLTGKLLRMDATQSVWGFLMLFFVIIQNYKYDNASMFIYMLL